MCIDPDNNPEKPAVLVEAAPGHTHPGYAEDFGCDPDHVVEG